MKSTINTIMHILLDKFFLHKYGGWYGLKNHIESISSSTPFLLQTYERYMNRNGSWIGQNAKFDTMPCFPHGLNGIFISGGAQIGQNVVIFHQVTIGSNTLQGSNVGSPTIGDNVYIGAGAKIIGHISIGDNCRIGANAVVYKDVISNSVAIQAHTRVLHKEHLNNRYYSQNPENQWVYWDNGQWIIDEMIRSDN